MKEADPGGTKKRSFEKRNHIRIRYPSGKQPLVTIRGRNYPVTDLSDMGARILCTHSTELLGTGFTAVFHFPFGQKLELDSRLEWADRNAAGLSFEVPIDLTVLLEEQQRLLMADD